MPFTYRTFGARGAGAQGQQGQHGYSQHLRGRDSPGKERGDVFSLLSSFNSPPPRSDAPSPFFILSFPRRVRKTVGWYRGPRGTEEPSRCEIQRAAVADGFCRVGTGEPRTPGPERATSQGGRTQVLLLPSPVVQLPSNLRCLSRSRFLRPPASPLPAHSSPPRRGMKSAA